MIKIPTRHRADPPENLVVLQSMALAPVSKPVESLQQAKENSVNSLLSKAYEKASTLELSKDEIKKLTADFDDASFRRGAGGNNELIYIEHQSLRTRLNEVIGIGKWNMIIRRSWNEDFTAGSPPKPACRVYVESVLIVKGCYVGEAIGDGTYYKSNASSNYGDAYESAKSAALRRCCKEFGIGLQPWNKDFCEAWKEKYKNFDRPKKK